MSAPAARRKVFIGASSGGVKAILEMAAALPPAFPAPIFFVQHIGAHRSNLDKLVSMRGPNPAVMASDGELPRAGMIYIAPPDRHMLLDGEVIRLTRGPKEHHSRPAIDPLFRSAALSCGASAIGVVLTGMLDDGAAGLRAIKDSGGRAVVQDPQEAAEPSMPMSALSATDVDHVVPLALMPTLLHEMVTAQFVSSVTEAPDWLRKEQAVARGENAMENLLTLGSPSRFTCPDCGGVLFDLTDRGLVRFRCHTGHAFSLRTLAYSMEEMTDMALWTSLRTLQEKEAVLRRVVESQRDSATASSAGQEADELAAVCESLRKLTQRAPPSSSFDEST